MKLNLAVSKKLRRPVAVATSITACALGLAWLTYQDWQQALAERNETTARVERLDDRLQRLPAEREKIQQRATLLRKLDAEGVVGKTEALSWDIALREIARQQELPALGYRSPPSLLTEEDSEFSLQTTRIQLWLRLRHEQQFLDFLKHLHREAHALVILHSCRLTRLPASSIDQTEPIAHLEADCELDWVTAQTKSAGTA